MAQLGWRQLPDGSWFNPFTGDLAGLDGNKEAAARAISERRTGKRLSTSQMAARGGVAGLGGPGYPTPPLPQQKIVALPNRNGVSTIIDPQSQPLAVSPFELGLGDAAASDSKKRFWMMGLILAAAAGYVWLNKRTSKAT